VTGRNRHFFSIELENSRSSIFVWSPYKKCRILPGTPFSLTKVLSKCSQSASKSSPFFLFLFPNNNIRSPGHLHLSSLHFAVGGVGCCAHKPFVPATPTSLHHPPCNKLSACNAFKVLSNTLRSLKMLQTSYSSMFSFRYHLI
jgi:hypothetical protein